MLELVVEMAWVELAQPVRINKVISKQWLDDSLPDFQVTQRLGLSFDVILLSAVWMHLPPAERPRAFRKLITLLKPGGLLALTLRLGPAPPERAMFEVSEHEIETLAKNHGAFIERRVLSSDQGGRSEISWVQLAVRLPDDGTGALPNASAGCPVSVTLFASISTKRSHRL